MPTDTIQITNPSPATVIVAAGDGPTLIGNSGPNTVWIGDNSSIQSSDGNGVVPLTAQSTYAVDGKNDVFGTVASGLPTTVFTIAGGQNFFQPVSSITLPTGATSGERIVINGLTGTITGFGPTGRVTYVISPLGIFMYV